MPLPLPPKQLARAREAAGRRAHQQAEKDRQFQHLKAEFREAARVERAERESARWCHRIEITVVGHPNFPPTGYQTIYKTVWSSGQRYVW